MRESHGPHDACRHAVNLSLTSKNEKYRLKMCVPRHKMSVIAPFIPSDVHDACLLDHSRNKFINIFDYVDYVTRRRMKSVANRNLQGCRWTAMARLHTIGAN